MDMKKYALVGTGGRATMFLDALAGVYQNQAQLVGLCDKSATRMRWHMNRLCTKFDCPEVPFYAATDFDAMIRRERPDAVIVCSMDSTHHEYIVRAMELGCDVISEKPMTTDAGKAKAILDAISRTGRNLRVTFNYRYTPATTKVRELIMSGVIGKPLSVEMNWMLDTSHGADYFRRWHREKDKSGGLLVHKATHHFDLINWWLDSRPEEVFAWGDLKFYGRKNAETRGESYSYDRYTGHPEADGDPFALRLDRASPAQYVDEETAKLLKGLYLDAEADSGYIRDRNVFGDNISIEDSMSVLVRYRSGVTLTYSLIAYSPWEGFRISITGTKGRLELYEKHNSHIIAGQGDAELAAMQERGQVKQLTLFPMFGLPRQIEIPEAVGGHGGGDPVMLEQIFSANPPSDPFKRAASHLDGAASILIGISANESMRTGLPVKCDNLLSLPSDEQSNYEL
jgi:predicted dehydrogenase